MSNVLRVCIFDPEPELSNDLVTQIQALNFVRTHGVVATEEDLATLLQSASLNLVFFHLDANPTLVCEVIENVATRFPDLALIAVSENTAPDAILAPMRAGCDQFVCEPIDHDDLASAVARAAAKRSLVSGTSRCICVTGSSGGVGATTIAANLALEIGAITDRKCALVDLDFQFGDLAILFDSQPGHTFYDLSSVGSEIDQTILETLLEDVGGNTVLLARPETIQQGIHLTPELITNTIDALGQVYENTIIDVPQVLDENTLAAFTAADKILMVCQLLVPSIRNTKRYFETLVSLGVEGERIEVVINRANSSGGRVTSDDLQEAVNKPPYAVIPNDYEYVAQAIDFGKPISSIDKRNPVRSAMHELASMLTGHSQRTADAAQAKRGLLGRILSRD